MHGVHPQNGIPDFSLCFPKDLSYGYLRYEGNRKIPLGRSIYLPAQSNFPISFKSNVAIAKLFWKVQRKTWYSILRVDAMPPFLKNLLFNPSIIFFLPGLCICHHPFQSKFFICSSKFDQQMAPLSTSM